MKDLQTICWYIIIYINKDIRDNFIHFNLLISNTDKNIKMKNLSLSIYPNE